MESPQPLSSVAEQWIYSSRLLALVGLKAFLGIVIVICLANSPTLFFQSHGWSHRLAGAVHLAWLSLGAITSYTTSSSSSRDFFFLYDVLLGVFGTVATLSAARDFPHKLVKNTKGQSGTLHRKAIVTQEEMLEHSFYQVLNLVQSVYLHASARIRHQHHDKNELQTLLVRLALLWLATLPWAIRHWFPVHSFSSNWKLYKRQSNESEVIMYRIKKAQYLFYKHVILHGVNISVAVDSSTAEDESMIPYSISWRIFWILLNLSYVMEFFLQTLVKRRILTQSQMLALNRWLMAAASMSALVVFQHVSLAICGTSLLLNWFHRHHDILNTMMLALGASMWMMLLYKDK